MSSPFLSYHEYHTKTQPTGLFSFFCSSFHHLYRKSLIAQTNLLADTNHNALLVQVNENQYINTLEILPPNLIVQEPNRPDALLITEKVEQDTVLVLLHGYGAGLGFFYKNFNALAEIPGYKIYALDWIGMGNSSRPSNPIPQYDANKSPEENVQVTESFFIDSLDKWREQLNIKKMILLGHSLGGYLSVAYAEKYPEYVEKLILVSPAGVGARPADLPPNHFTSGAKIPNWIVNFWTRNWTPQSIIRLSGPFGNRLLQKYTSRRFAHLPAQELNLFNDYLYHISVLPGSGEFALSNLLLPGAFARLPLHDRIQHLNIPITFLYGTQDWMNYEHAVLALQTEKMVQKKAQFPHRVVRIIESGHHLYSDNPESFNLALKMELENKNEWDNWELEVEKDGVIYVYK